MPWIIYYISVVMVRHTAHTASVAAEWSGAIRTTPEAGVIDMSSIFWKR